jgi:hypothetical protein
MNKPSERIVVFVTPAQKRAISATADELGISISELMRRAVLSFGATSEQVKAASIVDRLRAPRQPDALNEALQRAARAGSRFRQATPAALKPTGSTEAADADADAASAPLAPIDLARPVDPVAALAAVDHANASGDNDAQADAQAAARVTAAKAAAIASHEDDTRVPSRPATLGTSRRSALNARQREQADDDTGIDPAEGSGRFA